VTAVTLTIPSEVVEAIAVRAAEIVTATIAPDINGSTPYLTIPEAAEYLRCSRQRIYDLLSAGRLTRYKDGRRVLVARAELEAHLRIAETLRDGHRRTYDVLDK
jgi:excisionase family DNA binding protein